MSVIVALRVADKVYVGCDGRGSFEGRVISDDIDKVFHSKEKRVAVGAVGDLAEVQRVFRDLSSGKIEMVEKRTTVDFVDNGEQNGSAPMLIAIGGRGGRKGEILTRDAAGATLNRGDYAAIGDGADIACGAIEMAIRQGLINKSNPKRIVEEAVKIASKLSVFCGGKIRTYVV